MCESVGVKVQMAFADLETFCMATPNHEGGTWNLALLKEEESKLSI